MATTWKLPVSPLLASCLPASLLVLLHRLWAPGKEPGTGPCVTPVMDHWFSPSHTLCPSSVDVSQVISCPRPFPRLLSHVFSRLPGIALDAEPCSFGTSPSYPTSLPPSPGPAAPPLFFSMQTHRTESLPRPCHSPAGAPTSTTSVQAPRLLSVLLPEYLLGTPHPTPFLAWITVQWPSSQLPVWTSFETVSILLLECLLKNVPSPCLSHP